MGFPSDMTYEEEKKILPITNVLWKIFYTTIKDDDQRDHSTRSEARELAKTILEEWKTFLEAYNSGLRKAG